MELAVDIIEAIAKRDVQALSDALEHSDNIRVIVADIASGIRAYGADGIMLDAIEQIINKSIDDCFEYVCMMQLIRYANEIHQLNH